MVNTKKTIICFFQLLLIIISFYYLNQYDDYHKICVIGSIFVLMSLFLNIIFESGILNSSSIIMISFILFQFGLPILNAFDSNYYNWYIDQLPIDNLIDSVKISAICIQFFSFGLILSSNLKKKESFSKLAALSDNNSNNILNISKVLFAFSGIIAFPIAFYVAYLSSIYGYSYVKNDYMNLYNSVTRFAQQMIVPSMILYIVYSNSNKNKTIMIFISIIYAIILLFSGGRTTALALILVLLLLRNDEISINNNDKKNKNLLSNLFTIIGIFLLLCLGAMVAQYRYSGVIGFSSIVSIFESVIEEMGFNFTSIGFTKLFVPDFYNYKYGLSYLYSLICLIPKSIDPTGTIDSLHYLLPETWLYNTLSVKYNGLYNFGVGYSVIAEAYYNFGKYAFISIFLQGLLIGHYIRFNNASKFSKYTKYIMLFSLITYPRRTIMTLLKSIEYCIVLVIIIILFFTKRKNYISQNERRI